MKKLLFIIIGIIVLVLVVWGVMAAAGAYFYADKASVSDEVPSDTALMTIDEALKIASNSCVKGNEILEDGYYNEMSKTWWFDANLNNTPKGCSPACVVSEETKTAEINWRCTGLIEPESL